ncbi:MAG: thiamine pyrophosphate-dependent enzyme [Synergistota bacterium]|nr:thiamine pyrophosphate-dependent enzyme [Synergistota bacterium]
MLKLAEKYLRKDSLPLLFCPGCGNGQILNAFIRAIDDLGIRERIAAVSGIGCSSWIPVYLEIDVLHSLHGRALAFAQGLKLGHPEKKVVVFTGDGDCLGIGGNHLIHAARRNIDLTVIMVNNFIYGMTGGQKAPTTPLGSLSKTSPHGNLERPFDPCALAEVAGATYVARWSTSHPVELQRAIVDAISHRGFSFLEVMAQCPVQAGKHILKESDPWKMMQWYKRSCSRHSGSGVDPLMVVGEFVNREEAEFCDLILAERKSQCEE